ncbi:unnamed protein product [Paramecium primaurelia]|uniref:Rab GDP dissociation inhibitor n=3 Tax=Paramecium TaxID=5884 RepID=A0A8S1U5S2_9CILI|nr:unnamed protein product [Paramecium primaurelia]CAD8160170.1 unnamed protein product [Paramecium pentaurelia]
MDTQEQINPNYDVVVCGTGLIECILSGLLSMEGKRVFHMDRNPYYGGEGASLNLTNLWKLFKAGQQFPQQLGQNRDWNIDLIPKFVMANGQLVKILLKTKVARYLEWKAIDGTYVFQMKEAGLFSKGGGKIEKVPATASEALKSDLMGMFEKRRCQKFLAYVSNYEASNPKTHDGLNLNQMSCAQLLKKFELEPNTIDFIGHAVALYSNDLFLDKPAIQTIEKIKLYMDSIGRYGDSPFIYPIYGLGGIPEGFSRMAAVNGGTFMLNADLDEVLFDGDGKVCGLKSEKVKELMGIEQINCKMIIADPSYALKAKLSNKVKSIGKIVRCICILNHPIPNTKNLPSVQVIIPQRQTGRKNDIYVMMVSDVHNVCKKGFFIAILSTNVETNNPEKELEPAFEIVGPVLEKFITVSDVYVPTDDGSKDNIFISSSFDPQSHFEGETQQVLNAYKKITGKDLDLTNLPLDQDDQ